MAKARTQFICQNCGTVHPRWVGKCEGCGQWNTIVEEDPMGGIGGGPGKTPKKGRPVALTTLSGEIEEAPRIATGISELDRATGGGFVRGSAVLIGGDPGIGKSTVLMQAAAALARLKHRVIYVSGEEAVAQVRLRAQRLGAAETDVLLAAETNVEDILATLGEGKRPDLVIIDSIQTLWSDIVDSAPGTVTQVRTGVQAMIRFAKQTGATVVLVGHVTKEGQIAGPRVVEHMVDAVLYFEGDRGHHYRILRTVKNRFGPTDEIGVFEMSDKGLREVTNPSELFLGERNAKAPGAAVFAGMEGTRPVLVEVQALVAPTSLGTARRAVVGWDSARLSMILAVLEAHCGVRLGQHDVYLNVAGGYRITEPAADLAVASALVSSLAGLALPPDCVYFGEVSLSGAIRPVAHTAQRLKEAEKLGFSQAVLPSASPDLPKGTGLRWSEMEALPDLVARIAGSKGALKQADDEY
ncbi:MULTISPECIES: DNA repair protein RadA [unclassified Rhizobium]|uniref:DNA repair protein RadA n=1 Tax=unclassified Rhizobium TaxID=2613769 RepID=UPI00070131C7|nr:MULTISPECIES: DNA repair protein RadA [unclassified Rhizobium]KQV43414.1 DNA repair protein RadA [Rhizobium sp. Root1212]KRD37599.1 DNA repair protein RadA [Rhizobium sp. Root268]